MLRALVIAALMIFTATAARADGIYICDTLTGTTCSHFSALLDGVATFEDAGLTGEAIGEAVAFGMGAILIFFALGLGFGSAHRVFAVMFGSSEREF